MDFDLICSVDFGTKKFTLPKELPLNSLVFGLPYASENIIIEGSLQPDMNGKFMFKKSSTYFAQSEKEQPINSKSKIIFVTLKNNLLLVPACKIITYQQGATDDYDVFFGGHHVTADGPTLKKCFIDLPNGLFLLEDGMKIPFSMCYIAMKKITPITYTSFNPSKLRIEGPPMQINNSRARFVNFTYDVHELELKMFLEMDTLDRFTNPLGFAEISEILSTTPTPDVQPAYKLFLAEEEKSNAEFNCVDGITYVPTYLRELFGPNSPVFPQTISNFGVKGTHEIKSAQFKLLVKWLKHLVMRKQLPFTEEFLSYEMCIDEWLHISTYCDIPFFEGLFEKIKRTIEALPEEF